MVSEEVHQPGDITMTLVQDGTDKRYYVYFFENHGYNDYNIVEKFEFQRGTVLWKN